MKLSIGIVGLPNVGKSTLFSVITRKAVTIANYPFATIDPNVGVVEVPDERLAPLAQMSKSGRIVPAVVEFYDIAGLVKGANAGEGLGNQFLANIRETDAIVIVVRVFKDPDIVHVERTVDPIRDIDIINTELVFKDAETVDKRMASLEKETHGSASSPQAKKALKDIEMLKKVREVLARNELALPFRDEDIVRELQLLTAKKQLYLLNGDKEEVGDGLIAKIKALGADHLIENVALADAVPELIRKAYEVLDLISFLTTGEMETRAWTIRRGAKAPEAAGAIHTDFEKTFIRAEVVNWKELLEAGSWAGARQKGLLRVEGKEYMVQNGDVMVIRHGS